MRHLVREGYPGDSEVEGPASTTQCPKLTCRWQAAGLCAARQAAAARAHSAAALACCTAGWAAACSVAAFGGRLASAPQQRRPRPRQQQQKPRLRQPAREGAQALEPGGAGGQGLQRGGGGAAALEGLPLAPLAPVCLRGCSLTRLLIDSMFLSNSAARRRRLNT